MAKNKPISHFRCQGKIKETLAAVYENSELFSAHSLRPVGATSIARRINETPGRERFLRLQERWKSDCPRETYKKDSLSGSLVVTKSLQRYEKLDNGIMKY